MESKYGVREQPYESLDELSFDNLKRLTQFPVEMVRKLCNSGTEISLNEDEIIKISNSDVIKDVGVKGIKKLHQLGEIERISFEELYLLYYSRGELLSVPKLRKLCNAGAVLKVSQWDLDRLIAILRQIDLTVEEIKKLYVTRAMVHFTDKILIDLSKEGYIKSLSTENLTKYCNKTPPKIDATNMRKIFDKQEIMTHLSANDLWRLCNDAPFLNGATSEEILSVVRSGKYTTKNGVS